MKLSVNFLYMHIGCDDLSVAYAITSTTRKLAAHDKHEYCTYKDTKVPYRQVYRPHTCSMPFAKTPLSPFHRTLSTQTKITMASKVALVLGSGPRVGAAVSTRLASDGFKVAIASRKGTGSINEEGLLSLKADFSIPSTIPSLFDAVEKEFHAAPSVVIYNAASLTPPSDKESALSITEERVTNDLNVNVTSPFIAAQEAVKRWASSAGDSPKVFIYTGNGLNKIGSPVPFMMNLGVGKAASAYWIDVADANYAGKGYR